jgi:O-acetyl-ADP-ribose deacetylase (regulator of RNase III)
MSNLRIHKGSILDVEADAIVNPANIFLRHGAGLARVIDRAAQGVHEGAAAAVLRDMHKRVSREAATSLIDFPEYPNRPGRLQAIADSALKVSAYVGAHERKPLLATGNVYVTPPGLLPFKKVFHAVGPVWNGGEFLEHDLLQITYERIVEAMPDHELDSVAVPAISCGLFRFPVEDAALIAVDVLRHYDFDVTFALMEDDHVAAYEKAMEAVGV